MFGKLISGWPETFIKLKQSTGALISFWLVSLKVRPEKSPLSSNIKQGQNEKGNYMPMGAKENMLRIMDF